ncbi:hypothetical protein T4B_7725 [Trichinella pseudospiralis]|uniref:Uncharacterized protein n=1 Tax=Trichinella pseudospiralis TaxID=6337 RepID=A0A0V1I2W0_TRIPS|nr:hypothetical protein T4B_7725 [Trichinella pseudospiralis]
MSSPFALSMNCNTAFWRRNISVLRFISYCFNLQHVNTSFPYCSIQTQWNSVITMGLGNRDFDRCSRVSL